MDSRRRRKTLCGQRWPSAAHFDSASSFAFFLLCVNREKVERPLKEGR